MTSEQVPEAPLPADNERTDIDRHGEATPTTSGQGGADGSLETPSSAGGGSGLVADEAAGQFSERWRSIQSNFIDEPRASVQAADELVAEVIDSVSRRFGDERSRLEAQWESNEDVGTEDLRIALQRYRAFFERLLSA